MALSRATYNSSALTVTLLTRKALALKPPLDLTVRAASVLDALGRELDGNHSGGPGANFTAVLSKAGATVTSARERANRRPVVPCGRCRAGRGLTPGPMNGALDHRVVPVTGAFQLSRECRKAPDPSIRADLD